MKNIEEIWTLIAWLDFFKNDNIRLIATDFKNWKVCLENGNNDICYSFSLENKKQIIGANQALTLWANEGISVKKDCNGENLLEIEDWSKINSG